MGVGTITKVLRTVMHVKFGKFVDPGIQAVCISYPVCNIRREMEWIYTPFSFVNCTSE